MMKYDIKKLKSEIKSKETVIRELKGILRESGQPRKEKWGLTECKLKVAKVEATILYQLRAQMRNKIHKKGDTLELQLAFIGVRLALYELKDDPIMARPV